MDRVSRMVYERATMRARGEGLQTPGCPGARSVLNLDDVQRLFRTISAHPALRWSASDEGCEARADFVAEWLAEEHQIESRKIWASPVWKGSLCVWLDKRKSERVEWTYHVANVLEVTIEGACTEMVMDPALFREPVLRARWEARIRDDSMPGVTFRLASRLAYGFPYSYEGDSHARSGFMAKRDQTLEQQRNLNGVSTLAQHIKFLRAQFVDHLNTDDPAQADALIYHKNHDTLFAHTWSLVWPVPEFLEKIRQVGYLGISFDGTRQHYDISDPLLQWHLQRDHWSLAVRIFGQVEALSRKLQNLSNTSASAQKYKVWMETDGIYNVWRSPFGVKLWQEFGYRP